MEISNLKEIAMYSNWDSDWTSNWNECTEIALSIVQEIPIQICKQIALEYVEEYFCVFQQLHPENTWVKECLITLKLHLQDSGNMQEFILPEIDAQFSTPGSNGFIKELEELWELLRLKEDTGICQKAMLIISGIIMCKLDERWGSEQPNEWNTWYRAIQEGKEGDSGVLNRIKFTKNASVHRLNSMEWVCLANRLQSNLKTESKQS